ncbi:hypothetical protein TNCV_3879972 [Trichonephila clavipes]|nr:hypothetical protein TNCV_1634632 [Trichonephila clavipes]GFW38628.1 hypothetical protein TNCV_3879972 [Trichonephila clavipes]
MCSNRFQTTSDLRNHLTAVHRVNDPKGFICVYCEKSFIKKFNMQRHMKLIHKVDVQTKIDLTEVESESRIEGNSNDPIEAIDLTEVESESRIEGNSNDPIEAIDLTEVESESRIEGNSNDPIEAIDLTEVESESRIEGNSNDPIEAMPQQPMRAKTCCAHLSIRDLGR